MRRLLRALLTAGLTVAGVGVAAPASAAPCTITDFSPRSVTVGLTPVTTKFSVRTSGCSLADWSAEDDGFQFFVYGAAPQETSNPWRNSDAGPMDVIVTTTSSDWLSRERVFANGFALKRATAFQKGSFDAS
ncbi:hypothetical protein SAMN06893096_101347 [Geodermatophilus pulveris]|uniref:Uncharacterized protein n=1 Tax=Geodermatophilus pulveris TaxID=1564159 RepID=A0A239B082_9ACTN|nr:hypothetical protein [Geodermatophilus pulveris]SNS01210.1 hypothetical protein SAMN06893096_101347 [Geodermatophilus pulveris]